MSRVVLGILYERARQRPGTVAHRWPGTGAELAEALGIDVGTAYAVGLWPAPPPTPLGRRQWAWEVARAYGLAVRRALAVAERL